LVDEGDKLETSEKKLLQTPANLLKLKHASTPGLE
jgi:hypothetical protein